MKKLLLLFTVLVSVLSRSSACDSLKVDLGADTTLCQGAAYTLDAGNPGLLYQWSTGETTQAITVSTAAIYFVTVTDTSNNCTASDTIKIGTSNGPKVNLGNDTTICADWYFLDAGPAAGYIWSNGEKGRFATIKYSGTYGVEVFDKHGCSNSDSMTITIYSLPRKNLPKKVFQCGGGEIMLNAGNSTSTHTWNTGDETREIRVSKSGDYVVEMENVYGCRNTDTARVIIGEMTDKPDVIEGCSNACASNTISFKTNEVKGASAYKWVFPPDWKIVSGEHSNEVSVEVGEYEGMIWVYAQEYSESDTCDSEMSEGFYVKVDPCTDYALNIPNTFTPNGDGVNDNWVIRNIENYGNSELVILNRWGSEVYRTTKYNNEFNGSGLNDGTYYYQLVVKDPVMPPQDCPQPDAPEEIIKKGFVTIIR